MKSAQLAIARPGLEVAQQMAGHESAWTTGLYESTQRLPCRSALIRALVQWPRGNSGATPVSPFISCIKWPLGFLMCRATGDAPDAGPPAAAFSPASPYSRCK